MREFENRLIVICSQNFNGYGMLRTLGEAGLRPTLFVNRCKNPIVYMSRYSRGSVKYYDSVSEIPSILLRDFVSDSVPPILICCDDAIQSVVDTNYDKLSGKFILSHINHKQGEITRMMDKEIQMRLAEESGIAIPRTWKFKKGDKVFSVSLPCFAKASISIHGSKQDMRICHTLEELQEIVNMKDYLVQEYIKKDFEVIIWGSSIGNGEYFMTGVTRKIRHMPAETGMSSFGVVESFEDHPGLNPVAIQRFLKRLGYIGMFSIEMAVRKGVYYFLEINLRNDGKQHFSTVAGANLPVMYIASQLGLKVELPKMKYPTYYMGELTDYHHIGHGISYKEWIQDFKRTDCFFIANWKDPMPFISELYTKVVDTLRYRLGMVK